MEHNVCSSSLDAGYAPGRLLDAIKARLKLKTDSDLSRYLDVGAPLVSKMRSSRCGLSAGFLIRAQEACGLEIAEMRRLCGDRRAKIRIEKLKKRGAMLPQPPHKSTVSILPVPVKG